MSVVNLDLAIAEQNLVKLGKGVDLLKRLPLDALGSVRLTGDDGEPLTGYLAIKRLSLHLDLLAEAVYLEEAKQRSA